ncbi:ISAs1 family transposase [Vibrio lentus]
MVVLISQEGDKPAQTMQIKHYISSAKLTAKALLESTRAHWSIENQMHWRLDVGFKADECRIRREQTRESLAVIRHIALNLLTEETSFQAGIKRKQKKRTVATATFRKSFQGKVLSNLALFTRHYRILFLYRYSA